MKIEIVHYLNADWQNGVSHSEKIWSLFGVILKRKTFHYSKS